MNFPSLFSPVKIGPYQLPHRLVIVDGDAGPDGAKRIPGQVFRRIKPSRISLRSIRAAAVLRNDA